VVTLALLSNWQGHGQTVRAARPPSGLLPSCRPHRAYVQAGFRKFYHVPRAQQVQQFKGFQQYQEFPQYQKFRENLDIHDGYWHHHRQHDRR
jgi:hypothetical protein